MPTPLIQIDCAFVEVVIRRFQMGRNFRHHRIRHIVKTLAHIHCFNSSIVYLNHVAPRPSFTIEIIVYDGSRRLIGLSKADAYFRNERIEA